LKWFTKSEISEEELYILIDQWQDTYGITQQLSTQSSALINEVFTFFLILEQDKEFKDKLLQKVDYMQLEKIMAGLNYHFNRKLVESKLGKDVLGNSIPNISEDWVSYMQLQEAEGIFHTLDEDCKGHIDSEMVQFLQLAIALPTIKYFDASILRKQTFNFLKDLYHTNGLVSLRNFKAYFMRQGFSELEDLQKLRDSVLLLSDIWRDVRLRSLARDVEGVGNCNFLAISRLAFPSIWQQAIHINVPNTLKSSSYIDWEKLHNFLRFSGFVLGATPTMNTKGIRFIEGTYIRDTSALAIYLFSNYLELEGQYHTQVSPDTLTPQALATIKTDPRYLAIKRTVCSFDVLTNIALNEIYESYKSKVHRSPTTPLSPIPVNLSNSPNTSEIPMFNISKLNFTRTPSITSNSSILDDKISQRSTPRVTIKLGQARAKKPKITNVAVKAVPSTRSVTPTRSITPTKPRSNTQVTRSVHLPAQHISRTPTKLESKPSSKLIHSKAINISQVISRSKTPTKIQRTATAPAPSVTPPRRTAQDSYESRPTPKSKSIATSGTVLSFEAVISR
jgi:hypothetical protein